MIPIRNNFTDSHNNNRRSKWHDDERYISECYQWDCALPKELSTLDVFRQLSNSLKEDVFNVWDEVVSFSLAFERPKIKASTIMGDRYFAVG